MLDRGGFGGWRRERDSETLRYCDHPVVVAGKLDVVRAATQELDRREVQCNQRAHGHAEGFECACQHGRGELPERHTSSSRSRLSSDASSFQRVTGTRGGGVALPRRDPRAEQCLCWATHAGAEVDSWFSKPIRFVDVVPRALSRDSEGAGGVRRGVPRRNCAPAGDPIAGQGAIALRRREFLGLRSAIAPRRGGEMATTGAIAPLPPRSTVAKTQLRLVMRLGRVPRRNCARERRPRERNGATAPSGSAVSMHPTALGAADGGAGRQPWRVSSTGPTVMLSSKRLPSR